MGVITRKDITVEESNSLASSNQTLNISRTSSQESMQPQAQTQLQPSQHSLSFRLREQRYNLVRQPGRRKLRRLNNLAALSSIEEDEEDRILNIPHHSPFETILNDPCARAAWDNFNKLSEPQQHQLLNKDANNNIIKQVVDIPKKLNIHGKSWNAFFAMKASVKAKLKKISSIELLKNYEDELLTLLIDNVKFTKNSLSRSQTFLLQALSQYYQLKFGWMKDDTGLSVVISNPCGRQLPVYEETLYQHIYRRFHSR